MNLGIDMRRPFRSRCFNTCHFCIKTSPHGYKLHAIVRKLQELELRYSVISYLSYHSFNILDDLPKSDISYFLFITVPSAVRRPPSASTVRIRRPHPHFTESHFFFMCVELAKNVVWISSQGDKRYYWLERNIIFMFLSSCQISKIMSNYADLLVFNLCSLYKCCIAYICCTAAKFTGNVNNSPKNLYTALCLFICFTRTSGFLPSWNKRNNLC